MKTFTVNINPKLENVEITVSNGSDFTRNAIKGGYRVFNIEVNEYDLNRIKKYAVKYGTDNNSNRGKWYAHCNGFSMGLFVDYSGKVTINTYRGYGRSN